MIGKQHGSGMSRVHTRTRAVEKDFLFESVSGYLHRRIGWEDEG